MKLNDLDLHELNLLNQKRYGITAWFYDILDWPWERQYRTWRPKLLADVRGEVLEAGVGTGRNLAYYSRDARVTALDFSAAMLKRASRRCHESLCTVEFIQEDATRMDSVLSASCDWVIAFFLCCVLPEELQDQAIAEFARVLKPGGRFRLLEMQYSKIPAVRLRQDFFAPFVRKVYGAGFDRNTLEHVRRNPELAVTGTRYLKNDVYLLIEGTKELTREQALENCA